MKQDFGQKKVFWFFVVFIAGAITGIFSAMRGTNALEIFFSILVFLGILFFCLEYRDKVLSKILILGFILRSTFAYFQRFFFDMPVGGTDSFIFEIKAWQTAEVWLYGGTPIPLKHAYYYYSKLIAYLYFLFERTPLIPQFLNVLLGTFVIFVVYKTTLVLFEDRKTAHIAALMTAIFPVLIILSAVMIRDISCIFFLSLSFYFFSCWFKKGLNKYVLLSIITVFLSGIFHGAIILIGFIYLSFFILHKPKNRRNGFLLLAILAISLLGVFWSGFQDEIPLPSNITPEKLSEVSQQKARERASYLEEMKPKTYLDTVWQTPIRIIYFYLAPFPWQIENMKDLMGIIDVLLYVFLFIFAWKTLKYIKKRNKALFASIILIIVFFSTAFAWGTSNYGAALRHRAKIAFLLIITASYSFSDFGEKPKIRKTWKT